MSARRSPILTEDSSLPKWRQLQTISEFDLEEVLSSPKKEDSSNSYGSAQDSPASPATPPSPPAGYSLPALSTSFLPDLASEPVPHPEVCNMTEAEQYVTEVIRAAKHHCRPKRLLDDCELSPAKRARITNRLENLVYEDLQSEAMDDGDIIKLQMLAINGLQEEKNQLLELFRKQTARGMVLLSQCVKQRGIEMKQHGDFLVKMAETESRTASETAQKGN